MGRQETLEQRVAQHYQRPDLERTIVKALAAAGKDLDRLQPIDLAPVDEHHIGGREATLELVRQLGFAAGMRILDIGCGIGGAARCIAQEGGCHVTGIDLAETSIQTAEALSRRVGLAERTSFRQASALAIPFGPETFDGAYMLHVGMNIEDKPKLFAEIRRVLRPGSLLGIYDVMLTGRGEPRFPLPCAATAETCFIVHPTDYRRELQAAGFNVLKERNRLQAAQDFFRRAMAQAAEQGPPPLGIHLVLGLEAPRMFQNVVSLFEEEVLAPVEMICRAH